MVSVCAIPLLQPPGGCATQPLGAWLGLCLPVVAVALVSLAQGLWPHLSGPWVPMVAGQEPDTVVARGGCPAFEGTSAGSFIVAF